MSGYTPGESGSRNQGGSRIIVRRCVTSPSSDHFTAPGVPSLLVGREREQNVLRDHLAAARAGRGGLVLIGGEAGIGKTTLAEHLCGEATQQGALVLVGRCYDLTETPPYGPWVELFGRYQPSGVLPPLPPAFAAHGTIGEVASQATLFTQALDFLAALARQHPLVLLLDDLHWADPASLDLLRVVARTLADHAVLLTVTYRTDELTRRHPLYTLLPLLERETGSMRLDLRRLSHDAVGALVAARYHLRDTEEVRLAAYLHERTEGNALFLHQLLRALEENGILHLRDGDWALGDLTRVGVPIPLRQVIDARVLRLGEEGRRLLGVASVIGQEAPVSLWAAVAATDEEAILDLIDRAGEKQILDETPDGTEVRFAHALIREALYEGIPASRRRRMHRQVGEMFAALPRPDPDAVAYHYQRAGDARAAEWLIAAGERAQAAYAWLTAANRFETALARLEEEDAEPRLRGWLLYRLTTLRRFAWAADNVEQLDAVVRLAAEADDAALAAHARYYRGLMRLDGHDAGQMLDDLRAGVAALAALPPTEERASGLFARLDADTARGTLILRLARVGYFAEARAQGAPWLTEASADAGDGDWSASADALYGLGLAYAQQGEIQAAESAFSRACAILEARRHDPVLGGVLMDIERLIALPYHADNPPARQRFATAAEEAWTRAARSAGGTYPPRFAHAPSLLVAGEWDEAHSLAQAVYRELGYAAKEHASAILAPLTCVRGDETTLITLIHERLPNGPGTEPGAIYYNLALHQAAATWAIEMGDLLGAKEWLEAHDRWLDWSGAILGQSEGHALWARYHWAAGDTVAAYESATRAMRHATEPRQPLALLAAHRLLGELDTAAGHDDAEHHLGISLALADACAAPFERALTLLAFAVLRAATGKRAEALTFLDEVRAICIPLGAKPALTRADALGTRLSTMKESPPMYPAGLSAREVEVLRLVVAGQTNREIADTLFLSEHTVRAHVRNILTKTDTDNRAAATAFALRNGIA